jgi:spermidine synthase
MNDYDDQWVTEKWTNVETRYRVKSFLYEEKTAFQHMMLVDTWHYGKMLLLDGMVQTTEKDEFFYHEMMAHVPMVSHPAPKSVLIIGGGDGGVLREVLRHPGVEKAVMVEIDPKVVDFSRKYFPMINNGAFDDPRAELIFADGAVFVEKTDRTFDVAIIDSSDPIGPAEILFTADFYSRVKNLLNPGGIMVCQAGSLQMQEGEQRQVHDILRDIFQFHEFYLYTVPTYIGGLFTSVFCSDQIDPSKIPFETLNERYKALALETKYYNPGIQVGAFSIPGFLKSVIA